MFNRLILLEEEIERELQKINRKREEEREQKKKEQEEQQRQRATNERAKKASKSRTELSKQSPKENFRSPNVPIRLHFVSKSPNVPTLDRSKQSKMGL